MPRVLLAWEFGGGLGHVRRSLAIAQQLRDRGHEPLLAFADLGPLGSLDTRGIGWAQAPALARPEFPDPSPLNASDILLNLGFSDAASVAGALRGWSSLLHAWKPAALVADYAPMALLAARAAGLPRMTIGAGFSTLPVGDPMPGLRPWIALDPAHLASRDARLVSTVASAFDRALPRAPPPRRAADLFEADAHLVFTSPELDPFGPRGGVEYMGRQDDLEGTREVQWISDKRPRIFAYLRPSDFRFGPVLAAIERVAGEAIVAAPGLDPRQAAAASEAHVRVFTEPIVLASVLRGADLCVNHSGAGTASAAAAHGVAQALLPIHLEQSLVARRLADMGAATVLGPDDGDTDVERWLARASNEAARLAAQRLAAQLSRPPLDAAERIARWMGA